MHTHTEDGYYYVCVNIINAYGCTDEYCEEIAASAVGINDLVSQLHICPNPTTASRTIDGTQAGARINIRTLLGEAITQMQATGNTTVISLASLPDGLYPITLEQVETISTDNFDKL